MEKFILALAIPIEDNLLTPLYSWGKRFNWSRVSEVHLIHVVKKVLVPLEFSLTETPTDAAFREMKPTLNKHLQNQKEKILPDNFDGAVKYHLSCEINPNEVIVDALINIRASLLVVSTHGHKGFSGLFHSSFTEYMVKFSPCDVYVVRPE